MNKGWSIFLVGSILHIWIVMAYITYQTENRIVRLEQGTNYQQHTNLQFGAKP